MSDDDRIILAMIGIPVPAAAVLSSLILGGTSGNLLAVALGLTGVIAGVAVGSSLYLRRVIRRDVQEPVQRIEAVIAAFAASYDEAKRKRDGIESKVDRIH